MAAKPAVKKSLPWRITETMLAFARHRLAPANNATRENPFAPAKELHPPSVVGDSKLAMDDSVLAANAAWAGTVYGAAWGEGMTFMGYAELALLAQRPEYRRAVEVLARAMTRKWIKIKSKGDDEDKASADKDGNKPVGEGEEPIAKSPSEELVDGIVDIVKTDTKNKKAAAQAAKIAQIEEAFGRLSVKEAFQKIAEQDGYFGRAHLYIDTGEGDDREALKTPIGNGKDIMSKLKIKQGSIKSVKAIEAVWCYPTQYNSNDPLKKGWYYPDTWFVMGKELHRSRLLPFISREVPDLLKPAYSFGGLSLTQIMKPYVDNWLRTRQSVADIISAFSVFVLKTNLTENLNVEDGQPLIRRAELFNLLRDNRGLMMIDKNQEDFANVSASLSTLDVLQAQTQEHMAAVTGIPIIILLGIQPAGLNASSEGEIRAFYDWIHSCQEQFFRPNLTRLFNLVQLSEFGEVDDDLVFDFESLYSLTEKELAEMLNQKAQVDMAYVDGGVLSVEEVRARIANDPSSGYDGIDVDAVPEAPGMSDMGGAPPALDPKTGKPVPALDPKTGQPMPQPNAAESEAPENDDDEQDTTPQQ